MLGQTDLPPSMPSTPLPGSARALSTAVRAARPQLEGRTSETAADG